MKKLIKSLALSLLVVGTAAYATTSMKIGVIDLPQILQKSAQVTSINSKLRDQFTPQQQQIVAAQNKIREEVQQLNPKDKPLTADAKTALQNKISADQKSLQQMVTKFQADVSKAQSDAMKSFMDQINTAVSKIAKDQSLDIVLLKPAVVYPTTTVDITDQVIKALPGK